VVKYNKISNAHWGPISKNDSCRSVTRAIRSHPPPPPGPRRAVPPSSACYSRKDRKWKVGGNDLRIRWDATTINADCRIKRFTGGLGRFTISSLVLFLLCDAR